MSNDKSILLECEIFPCIAWYKNYLQHPHCVLEQYEHFERTTLRNRYYLAGPNGMITLSIPLLRGRNQRTIMKDVKIHNEEKWQQLHWKTIMSCYRRSPYFEYFEEALKPLFETKPTFLVDYNMACLQKINELLAVKKDIVFTDSYEKTVSENVLDLRNTYTAENYVLHHPSSTYIQVFQERIGFKNNLSILDMLFCVGKKLVDDLV